MATGAFTIMRITDWIVLNNEYLGDLQMYVNQFITKGYQPFGSLLNIYDSWLQPMVKYEKRDQGRPPNTRVEDIGT